MFEAKISCLGACSIAPHATAKCAVRGRGLACMAAGRIRAKSDVGLNNLVTGAEVRDFPRRGFQTQISSRRIGEWLDTLSMAALVDLKPQESAWAFDLVAWWGFVDVVVA